MDMVMMDIDKLDIHVGPNYDIFCGPDGGCAVWDIGVVVGWRWN